MYSDVYLDCIIFYNSGRFIKFKVQVIDDVCNGKGGSIWKCKQIKNVGFIFFKVFNWVFGYVDDVNKLIKEYSFGDIV